jgi:3-oxoacyl-[acyl-carrier-protein] synthase-1/3-oxoacyl-[acyl-carrier-protein] synthase II
MSARKDDLRASGVAIVAAGACSPLGIGAEAVRAGRAGERAALCVARDEELVASSLARPYVARARVDAPASIDRATALLEHALAECARELDAALPGWQSLRVGAAIGTSSGGMRSFEELFGPMRGKSPDALSATYVGPLAQAKRPCAFEPVSLVLGACASSTLAIGLGRAWLLEDRCDVVLCGGFDAVSVFVAAGFECLRATCGEAGPRPFRAGRDGLALGEGAAVLALVRARDLPRACATFRGWVNGFGATCDAAHLTAPSPRGEGLARAARAALEDAGRPAIELVSAHGTATPQNDAAEAAALGDVLGARREQVPVFSFKGTIGHTLGAAGALEALAATDAMAAAVAPASAGEGPAEGGLVVLDRGWPHEARAALKLSSAFGGANAALVLGRDAAVERRRVRGDVWVSRARAVTLADAELGKLAVWSGYSPDRLARADDLVRLAIAAVCALEDASGGRGSMRGAGIVVGHGLATIETNARFLARIVEAGASRAEPRRFPYTTPNAAAGECAVAFGLTGPAFAVGGGPHGGIEALGVAADLVRARVVDRVVVVAADEAGEASRRIAPGTESGAVALLVTAAPPSGEGRAGRLSSCAVRFNAAATSPTPLPPMHAHRALLPLAEDEPPAEVAVDIPWGGIAKARFLWL